MKRARRVGDRVPAGYGLDPHQALAAAVVRDAIKGEGLGYIDTEGGQFWLDVMGLDVSAVRREAMSRGMP